ncbi:MAG: hypothetical protein VKQ33_10635 [Candidatus Sericytochromatia bacterium]|nr:hypothetical protein [Candidatus Sericytochromatia bacterium]
MPHADPHRPFLAAFLGLVLAWAGGFNALSAYVEPVSGDLARVGGWAERDFGGRGPAAPMAIRANGGPGAPPPAVLVLGDSHSHPNVWQTVLAEATGLEPLTCSYWTAGSLARWTRWAARQPARTWVLQVAERHVVADWGTLGPGAGPDPSPLPVAAGQTAGRRPRVAWNPDYAYVARASWNHVRLARQPGLLESGETVVAPLTRGDLFTCRRADRLLYFRHDATKDAWREADLAAATHTLVAVDAAARAAGARLLLAVVPDKSTTYAPWLLAPAARPRYEALQRRWAAAGLAPVDVLTGFRRALPATRDLYGPDDSHLGPVGHQLLAAAVARAMVSSGLAPTHSTPR